MRKVQTAIGVGFLIGVSTMMALISLETAIYWGQLSGCSTKYGGRIDQYTCDNPSGMKAVVAFASLLFIVQTAFTGMVVQWKDDFIESEGVGHEAAGGYSDITNGSPGFDGPPYDANKRVSTAAYSYDADYSQANTADL